MTATVLNDQLAATIIAMGYEFVGCEMQRQGRQTLLRIYIDRALVGVTLEDCTAVSRQLSAMLDVEDPMPGQYVLEVSSPGLNRPLFTLAHYQRFVGSQVKLRVSSPVEGRSSWLGRIDAVVEEIIHLLPDATPEQVIHIPFALISKGHIIADIKIGAGKGVSGAH